MKIKYSLIIPTLNEEYFIGKNLELLRNKRKDVEIIVVDGGSEDDTVNVALKNGVEVIFSEKGRGIQLNAGVLKSKGSFLFFLHADTFLPQNAFDLLDSFFKNDNNNICRFELGFDVDHYLLSNYSFLSKFDTIFTRFGDSGIIVKREFFKSLGGFKNYLVFEDVEFLKRASQKTKIKVLPADVKSSARKFVLNGLIGNQIQSFILFLKYFMKINNSKLWNEYFGANKENKNTSLLIFARYPAKGQVKTRLAKDSSEEFALKFYRACAEGILHQIKKLKNTNKYLFYTDADDKEKVMKWAGRKYFYVLQEGGDLGIRMLNAFELAFSHYAGKVIIVGTDVPNLNAEIIREAEAKLDNSDLVIGPCSDGGYYLLGMKQLHKELFEDIKWSSNIVLSSTIAKADYLNLKTERLQILNDIDTKKDFDEWMNLPHANPLKRKINYLTQ